MKMKAPEGTNSAAVGDTQYEVDEDGHIEIENGEHIPQLEAHGFEQVPGETTQSEPVDEIGECPDFSKFVNRQALVDWLTAHELDGVSAEDDRQDLEALCLEHYERVAAGHAHRVRPEASEEVAEEEEEGCPDFSKFANRGELVDWLAANGHEGADAEDSRANLEALCVETYELAAAGGATE